jgi:hypothetical protein
MFRAELEMFAESCRTGKPNELSARSGNVAIAIVYAALQSVERRGQAVRIEDVITDPIASSQKETSMLPKMARTRSPPT